MFNVFEKLRWQQARRRSEQKQPLLIGVTGSANLALTAEAIALVLQKSHTIRNSLVTRRQPPEIGEASVAIAQIPAPHPGDVDAVSQQLPWQIAVATTVGSKHLNLFGNKEMVAHEHTSLISALPQTGHAVINADDELVANMALHTGAHVTLYGTSARPFVRLIRSARLSTGGFAIEVAIGQRHYQLALPHILAFSQIYAVLAALAVGHIVGGDVEAAIHVLPEIHPAPGELSLATNARGAKIVDGSADATPETMLAALHALHTFPAKRRIAILGDIEGLGAEAAVAHKNIGRTVAESVHLFVAVGELMRHAGARTLKHRSAGPSQAGGPDVHHFNSASEVGEWLAPYLTSDDAILVMGSPEMHMEKVVAELTK